MTWHDTSDMWQCHEAMSCWLTEQFDGGGKLISVMQFERVIKVLLMSGDNW